MNKERLQLIPEIIKNLRSCESNGLDYMSRNEVYKAKVLFGNAIPEIGSIYRNCVINVENSARNAGVVACLLEEYLLIHKKKETIGDKAIDLLKPYNAAYRHYANGLAKYQEGIYERNTLDDMRAALESLIREITGKEKKKLGFVNDFCVVLPLPKHTEKEEVFFWH